MIDVGLGHRFNVPIAHHVAPEGINVVRKVIAPGHFDYLIPGLYRANKIPVGELAQTDVYNESHLWQRHRTHPGESRNVIRLEHRLMMMQSPSTRR